MTPKNDQSSVDPMHDKKFMEMHSQFFRHPANRQNDKQKDAFREAKPL